MVVATEVQDAVNGGLGDVIRMLRTDDDVAELARSSRRTGAIDREREHVGGRVASAVGAIELVDPVGVNQLHRQMPVADAGRRKRRPNSGLKLDRHVVEVEAQSVFVRSEYSS